MSVNSKEAEEVLEKLIAHPLFSAALNERLAQAEASFRKQGIAAKDMHARLNQTAIIFIKKFLSVADEDDVPDLNRPLILNYTQNRRHFFTF